MKSILGAYWKQGVVQFRSLQLFYWWQILKSVTHICYRQNSFPKTRWWPHCKVGTNIFHHNLTSRICGKRVFLCSVFKATFDIHSNMQNDIFMHRYRHLTVFLTSASCWTVPAVVCLFLWDIFQTFVKKTANMFTTKTPGSRWSLTLETRIFSQNKVG